MSTEKLQLVKKVLKAGAILSIWIAAIVGLENNTIRIDPFDTFLLATAVTYAILVFE